MLLVRSLVACAVMACSLAVAGCSGEGPAEDDADAITKDDVVELGDLLTADADKAAAAAVVGDPATILAEAQREAEVARGDVTAVFKFIREAAAGEPARKGKVAKGVAYAVWEKNVEGVDIRLTLIRTAPDRVRYLLEGKGDSGDLPLLTGIFIKKGPGTGGGRFHVNLSNVSDLYGAPGADGSVHFWFANHNADKRGRRIVYADVVRRDDPSAAKANFGADLVRLVGVGGRFRSVGVADAIPEVAGNELFALRVLWKAGEGGRGDAAIASLADPANPVLLGKAHECWDAGGLRTAYADDVADNDAENPNEGDTKMCFGFPEEDVPDSAASPSGADSDPDLEMLLDESGASDVSEQEAQMVEKAE